MTEALGYFCGGVAVLALVALYIAVCQECAKNGRERGYKEGYAAGRKSADEWWLNSEREVDQERQKIWREEG